MPSWLLFDLMDWATKQMLILTPHFTPCPSLTRFRISGNLFLSYLPLEGNFKRCSYTKFLNFILSCPQPFIYNSALHFKVLSHRHCHSKQAKGPFQIPEDIFWGMRENRKEYERTMIITTELLASYSKELTEKNRRKEREKGGKGGRRSLLSTLECLQYPCSCMEKKHTGGLEIGKNNQIFFFKA